MHTSSPDKVVKMPAHVQSYCRHCVSRFTKLVCKAFKLAACVPFLHVDLVTGVPLTKALPVTAVFSAEALPENRQQQTRLMHMVQDERTYAHASGLRTRASFVAPPFQTGIFAEKITAIHNVCSIHMCIECCGVLFTPRMRELLKTDK